jgi:tetratricopeptide (TPR) repeat protein
MRFIRRGLPLLILGFATLGAADHLDEATRELYRGNYQKAAALAEQRVKANPKDAAARVMLARARLGRGENDAAWRELQRALRLDPANVDALYFLGRLSELLAQVEFRNLYAMAPDSARVHQLLAESADAAGNREEAVEEYMAALKGNPRSEEVLIALGDIKRMGLRFEEAAEYYRRALEINSRDYDSAYGLGVCHLRLGQPDKAEAPFRRAAALDPGSAVAHFALGDALFQLGKPEEAMRALETAAKLEPAMRQAYILLGRAYQEMGRREEAAEAFRKVREMHRQELEDIQAKFEKQRRAAAGEAKP